MADKSISELTQATEVTDSDLFVLQQGNVAKKLSGSTLKNYVVLDVVSAEAQTLPAGSDATANYDKANKTLQIGVPTGLTGSTGPQGATGPANTLKIGTVTSGNEAGATITGTAPNQTLNLVLPKGDKGDIGPQGPAGPANVLTIGSVTSGNVASVTITGEAPNQTLNFVLEKGDKGDTGSNFTILGYFDTLAALQATVPNPKAGDAYGVGTAAPYDIYIWDSVHSKWVNNGNLQAEANLVIAEIPKGRMRGDIKGTGKVGTADDLTSSQYYLKATDPANPDSWACDVNADGTINENDVNMLLTSTPTFADFYNNWAYHKVDDKSGYWTTDLAISGITAETDVSISVQGNVLKNTFIKAEPLAGGVRIHANYPPIHALPCSVTYGKGTGQGIICAVEGIPDLEETLSAKEIKTIRIKLLAANWSSSDQTQVVDAPGVIYSQRTQLIIPMPAYSKSVEYHDAGILCIGRGDDELTFKCKTIPTVDIPVYVTIAPVNFVQ